MKKRYILIAIAILGMIGFAIRELRLPLPSFLSFLDLESYAIEVPPLIYTIQNLISFWGLALIVILLVRWNTPEIRCGDEAESKLVEAKTDETPKSRSHPRIGRKEEKSMSPFETVPKWKVVVGNPKAKKRDDKKK